MKAQYLALAYGAMTAPVAVYVSYIVGVECAAGKFEWGMVAAVGSIWFAVGFLPWMMVRFEVRRGN